MAYLSFSCTALKLLHWKVQFRMLETGKDPLSPNEYFTQKGIWKVASRYSIGILYQHFFLND